MQRRTISAETTRAITQTGSLINILTTLSTDDDDYDDDDDNDDDDDDEDEDDDDNDESDDDDETKERKTFDFNLGSMAPQNTVPCSIVPLASTFMSSRLCLLYLYNIVFKSNL